MFGLKQKKRNVGQIVASLTAMETELREVVDEEEIYQKERNDEISVLQNQVEISKNEASRATQIASNIGALIVSDTTE